MLMNKYMTFGAQNGQIKLLFAWSDSFTGQKVQAYSAMLEALSSKYNYAVCLARLACYMSLEGDGIKHACKYMQQAAWIFEDLKQNVSMLSPADTTTDFTNEALSMLSNLMLAQAQYLFYKLATDKKQSAEILSKIALQISNYFGQSYEFS